LQSYFLAVDLTLQDCGVPLNRTVTTTTNQGAQKCTKYTPTISTAEFSPSHGAGILTRCAKQSRAIRESHGRSQCDKQPRHGGRKPLLFIPIILVSPQPTVVTGLAVRGLTWIAPDGHLPRFYGFFRNLRWPDMSGLFRMATFPDFDGYSGWLSVWIFPAISNGRLWRFPSCIGYSDCN
jgi:hypothetical protein